MPTRGVSSATFTHGRRTQEVGPYEPWWRLLTIVVSSSPVPSNPDTTTLRAGMASLALVPGLPHCAKVIQFDGPQKALPVSRVRDYVEFKRRVHVLASTDSAFSGSTVYESERFLFAAHNLAAAIKHVNTTFLLNLQHDYQLARRFDAPALLQSMLRVPNLKHVRLNMRPNAPARGFDGVIENFSAPGLTVPLTRTCGWSDSPHVARTSYYREFVIPRNLGDHNSGRRKFMEESLHYPMQRNFRPGGCWELKQKYQKGIRPLVWPADFDKYGTYLYGLALTTDGSYTVHRSLRGNLPQWGLEHNPKADLRRTRVDVLQGAKFARHDVLRRGRGGIGAKRSGHGNAKGTGRSGRGAGNLWLGRVRGRGVSRRREERSAAVETDPDVQV